MQGAGLNVMLKVYILHDMHPGNMWKVGEGTTMHEFPWMLSLCWFKICLFEVGVLYILAWFRGGLGFEYHLDDNAHLLDR